MHFEKYRLNNWYNKNGTETTKKGCTQEKYGNTRFQTPKTKHRNDQMNCIFPQSSFWDPIAVQRINRAKES